MAIFAIMALGIGVFAGVTTANPSMMATARQYIEEHRLFDFRMISTWGFVEEEVERINNLDMVRMARGSFSVDFVFIDEQGDEEVLRTYSICDDINRLTLVEGRLPVDANEIVLDSDHFPGRMIGEEIRVFHSGNIQGSEDIYAESGERDEMDEVRNPTYESYVVTGLVRSPMYMNLERGVTTIGNGQVRGFGYLLPEAFTGEFYSQVFVYLDSEYMAFTQEYNDHIESVKGELENIVLSMIEERTLSEIEDARLELDEAKQELEDKTIALEEELSDALTRVEEGEEELSEAREELEETKEELEDRLEELDEAYQDLTTARRNYQRNRDVYTEQRRLFDEAEAEYQEAYATFQESRRQFEAQRDEYRAAVEAGAPPDPAIEEQIAALEQQVTEGIAAFAARRSELDTARDTLAEMATSLYEGGAGFEEAEARIEEGREEIEEALSQIEEIESNLDEEERVLANARIEIDERVASLELEIEDARQELIVAQEKLDDVTDVRLFVLDRHTNVGYASFEGDIEMVGSIARVLPIFFLLIAALICSTTMTRMIDEEHSQIGIYRAMGYEKGAILAKYIVYSGSAAMLGGVVGFFVGVQAFPRAIWLAYSMLYGFSDGLIIIANYWLLLICLAVALMCTVGMTFLACRLELRKEPAQLIRPKMPSVGKRVWLERIPFVWKNMRFLHKVTARNIFRFKKRMFMMLIGIAGCMALVLAGLGLRDSVNGLIGVQYGQILNYDISASFSRGISETFLDELEENHGRDIARSATIMQQMITVDIGDVSKRVNLLVEEEYGLTGLINFLPSLREAEASEVGTVQTVHITGEPGSFVPAHEPGRGEIAIDERLARAGNFAVGDEIVLQIGDDYSRPVRISSIFENYVMHYARMSAETFNDIFENLSYETNTVKITLVDGTDDLSIASWISNQPGFTGIQVVSLFKAQVGNMLDSLDYVVMLIIASAALLAFIVLFNLGNINISERVREIATLKVLGFYPGQTASYVFRENFILTLIGIGLGVPLGMLFHNFIISQINIDMISFKVIIHPISYGIAALTVLVFSIVTDIILRRKLERIKMVESLKAAE
jgi:putative ABC transport system permease protein